VTLVVLRRGGATVTRNVILTQDPTVQQVVPIENLTQAQKAFRDSWLATKVR